MKIKKTKMLLNDRVIAEARRENAFNFIKKDPFLWECWNDAETDRDRELIIAHVLYATAFKAGYDFALEDKNND